MAGTLVEGEREVEDAEERWGRLAEAGERSSRAAGAAEEGMGTPAEDAKDMSAVVPNRVGVSQAHTEQAVRRSGTPVAVEGRGAETCAVRERTSTPGSRKNLSTPAMAERSMETV
jgi:hypothetical protein